MPLKESLAILVVDDAPTMRSIIKGVLLDAGFKTVLEAGDGREACRILEKNEVSLVITDMKMPRMTGLELLQTIRARPKTACLPVLIVTGESDRESVVAAIKAGVADYVLKPISATDLLRKIVKVLARNCS